MSKILQSGGAVLSGSIQRGAILAGGTTSTTATITSVDVNNSRLRMVGSSVTAQGINNVMAARLALTNATTVTQTTDTASTAVTSTYEVSPLRVGALKSIQRGTLAANTTATITSVTVANTELDFLGVTNGNGGNNMLCLSRVVLTNATTVTSTGFDNGSTSTIGYQAPEYNP